jgi:hypothetical protein
MRSLAAVLPVLTFACTLHEPGSPQFFGNRDGDPCPQWVSDAARPLLEPGWRALLRAQKACLDGETGVSPASGTTLHRSGRVLQVSAHCTCGGKQLRLPDLARTRPAEVPPGGGGGFAVSEEGGEGEGWVAWRERPRCVWLQLRRPCPSGEVQLVVEALP